MNNGLRRFKGIGGLPAKKRDEVMKKYINDIQRSIENQKKNQTGIENNYLSRGGDNYINSRHNNIS